MVRNARSRAQRLNARNRAARRAQELPQGMPIEDEARGRHRDGIGIPADFRSRDLNPGPGPGLGPGSRSNPGNF